MEIKLHVTPPGTGVESGIPQDGLNSEVYVIYIYKDFTSSSNRDTFNLIVNI